MTNTVLKRMSTPWICSSCRQKGPLHSLSPQSRLFTTSSRRRAENQNPSNSALSNEEPNTNDTLSSTSQNRSSLSNLNQIFDRQPKRPSDAWAATRRMDEARRRERTLPRLGDMNLGSTMAEVQSSLHHFHVYATKHNTHITFTNPARDPVLSLSAGNIGFRKAGRGSYDAAYQLAAYVLKTLQEKGVMGNVAALEVVLRGFGPGREAVTKVLLGSEGRWVRGKIRKVTDATRLKFGGTRSPKPRRLG